MGVFVVVVEDVAFSDVDLEEPAAPGGEDTLGGCPYFGGVFDPPGAALYKPGLSPPSEQTPAPGTKPPSPNPQQPPTPPM